MVANCAGPPVHDKSNVSPPASERLDNGAFWSNDDLRTTANWSTCKARMFEIKHMHVDIKPCSRIIHACTRTGSVHNAEVVVQRQLDYRIVVYHSRCCSHRQEQNSKHHFQQHTVCKVQYVYCSYAAVVAVTRFIPQPSDSCTSARDRLHQKCIGVSVSNIPSTHAQHLRSALSFGTIYVYTYMWGFQLKIGRGFLLFFFSGEFSYKDCDL